MEEMEISVMPRIKALQFNHVLVTANVMGRESNIILPDSQKNARVSKDIQTVLMKGATAGIDHNGISTFDVGDTVMLDNDKLQAKNSRVITVSYNNMTGEVYNTDNHSSYKEDYDKGLVSEAFLITDREILFALS